MSAGVTNMEDAESELKAYTSYYGQRASLGTVRTAPPEIQASRTSPQQQRLSEQDRARPGTLLSQVLAVYFQDNVNKLLGDLKVTYGYFST